VIVAVMSVLTTFLGSGDPEVGDCIRQEGIASFEKVDCGADDTEYEVVGTDDGKVLCAEGVADPAEVGPTVRRERGQLAQ
jgi:hypothetical protein